MQCSICGTQISDSVQFCTNCTVPVNHIKQPEEQSAYTEQFSNQQAKQAPNAMMSKNEFYRQPALKKYRICINITASLLYFSATVTFLVHILIAENILGLIDVLLLIGFALGIQIGKSRIVSIIITIYASFNTIYMLVETGNFNGWLILIAGISAIIYTFGFQKAWKNYQKTGALPPQ